jgi:hypothetical protein
LKDEEKFKDNQGNILEIETRGIREHDKIYFKVKDVALAFDLPNIENNIQKEHTTYNNNIDYKFFICNTINNKVKKELFLTLAGFKRVIECTRKNFSNKTKYILHKWLIQNFEKVKINSFKININKDKLENKIGYTYCITSPHINTVKIGMWRGNILDLYSRYKTYYGNELDLYYVKTKDAYLLEQECHTYFNLYKISNELFKKDYLENYISFLEANKEEVEYISEEDINSEENEYNEIIDNIKSIDLLNTYNEDRKKNIYNIISKLTNIPFNNIQELFSINARELPCVYLTAFNTVEVLRDTMNIDKSIPNDSIVYKFGLTKSFEIRKNGHKNEYKELDKLIDMKLAYYTYIDPLYISEAETEIKTLLEDYKIKYENHDELVIIPNNMLKFIKKIYENLGMKYSGHTAEFNKKINELEMIINNLKEKHNNLILNHQIELQKEKHDKELQKEKYENLLLKKEVEIMKLQLQIKQ